MKLLIYEKYMPNGGRSIIRKISVSCLYHRISCNVCLTKELGLTGDTHALLARDEESRNDWYISFGDFPQGMKAQWKKGYIVINCKKAVEDILNSVNATDTATFLVGKDPVEIEGNTWYKIITSKPTYKN